MKGVTNSLWEFVSPSTVNIEPAIGNVHLPCPWGPRWTERGGGGVGSLTQGLGVGGAKRPGEGCRLIGSRASRNGSHNPSRSRVRFETLHSGKQGQTCLSLFIPVQPQRSCSLNSVSSVEGACDEQRSRAVRSDCGKELSGPSGDKSKKVSVKLTVKLRYYGHRRDHETVRINRLSVLKQTEHLVFAVVIIYSVCPRRSLVFRSEILGTIIST